MNFVKWLRKNNTKIMAVVVIVLMVGFVGGSSLSYLLQGSGGMRDTIAYFGDKHKITNYDVVTARQEMEILQALQADRVLQAQDVRGILLSELLFSQSRGSAAVMNYAMQTIRRNQYHISDRQLGAMYERTVPPAFYWILLREEAQRAGIHVPVEDVGGLLARIIPQLFQGQGYPAVIGSLVNRFGVSEEKVLEIMGNLLAVLQYAQTLCSTESVTVAQVKHMARRQNETLDVEFVQVEAAAFAEQQSEPTEAAVRAHFATYKAYVPGEVTEDNPFGFGYKLPDRLQLDYVALKLEDVASIVQPPTGEEAERYYQQNRERLFTEQVASDANDPDSTQVPRVTPYAELTETIMDQLRQQKITTKAEQILVEARNLADAEIEAVTAEGEEPTVEQIKEKMGNYDEIAGQLSTKHGIPLYHGQTGWLSARDVQSDQYLGRMFLAGYGASPVRLSQVLFSVEALGDRATAILFARSAPIYTTIGPASEPADTMGPDLSGRIMMIARVAGVETARSPERLDLTFGTKAVTLNDANDANDSSTYSVTEKVVEDLRTLAGWDTARDTAAQLLAAGAQEGWDQALAKLNQAHREQTQADPNDPNVFRLDRQMRVQRIAEAQLQVLIAQTANNASAEMIRHEARTEKQFIDELYAVVPADPNAAPKTPLIVESKPKRSFYVVKDVSIERLTRPQYDSMKGMFLQQEDYAQTQSLAAVHFNPANVLKRMNFRPAKPAQQPTEDEEQQESEDAA